jgi:hypothetical protein
LMSARALWTIRSSRSSSGLSMIVARVDRMRAREGDRMLLRARDWRRGVAPRHINRGLYQQKLMLFPAWVGCQHRAREACRPPLTRVHDGRQRR